MSVKNTISICYKILDLTEKIESGDSEFMETEIKVENISKSFDTQQVLDHITMDFQRGYIHLLNGNNGCGKSTLLKIMYGLMIPDEGTVYWNEKKYRKQ